VTAHAPRCRASSPSKTAAVAVADENTERHRPSTPRSPAVRDPRIPVVALAKHPYLPAVSSLGAKQRRHAIMDENSGGAGRFTGAFAMGDRARLIKTAVARNPDWESGPRCIEVPFFVAPGNGEHA
jgi:hypothetical protein